MGDIVQVGDFSIARKGRIDRFDPKACRHIRVEQNDHGETVTCRDCGVQVSAYWALNALADFWKEHERKYSAAVRKLNEDKAAKLHLIAARVVEKAWRSHSMVPCCPHCGEGINAKDGFGETLVSKRIDEARRAARKGGQPNG